MKKIRKLYNHNLMLGKSIAIIFFLFTVATTIAYSQSNDTISSDLASELEERREGTKKLDFLIGEWATETWYYGGGKRPDKPEKGTYSAYWVLNNTFITDDIYALHNGKEYMGKGYHSYNPKTELYETWYFDSDGIVVLYANGQWEDEKTLVFKGKDVNPSGIVEKRTYFKITSPNAFDLVEKQDYGNGKGFVMILEVKYKRVFE